jgi:hypothetical protein
LQNVEIGSAPLYFVDPKIDLRSRECLFPRMVPETGNGFVPWHDFAGEEFDDMALLDFHIIDTSSPIETFACRHVPAMILDALHFHTAK